MIFVNFKVYKEGTGSEAIKLIRVLEEVAVKTQIKIIPVVQAADIKEAVESTKLEVWTQHVDPVEFGAFTGNIIPEAVFEDGAIGTFLNHSEHKFADFDTLAKANSKAKEVGVWPDCARSNTSLIKPNLSAAGNCLFTTAGIKLFRYS